MKQNRRVLAGRVAPPPAVAPGKPPRVLVGLSRGCPCAAHAISRRGAWVFVAVPSMPGTEDERVAGVLADGRVAVPVAPWFGGSMARARTALAEYERAVAEIERRGVVLIETRFVKFAATTAAPPYDLERVEDAARAAAEAVAGR